MSATSDWELLARYLSAECSEEEKVEVERLIAADPDTQRLIATMSTVWETSETHIGTPDVSKLWGELARQAGIATRSEIDQNTRVSAGSEVAGNRSSQRIARRLAEWFQPQLHPLRRYAVAAVLLIVSSVVYYWAQEAAIFPLDRQNEWAQRAVEIGARGELTLGDGTRIRLDAGSVLRYPETFDKNERLVLLTGEGFFEVASDEDRPFVVRARHAVVKVLGTEFNLRAWPSEERVTVAVGHGKISFGSEAERERTVEIEVGQMSTLKENGLPSAPRPADIERHLGWVRREAFFDSVPLREVLYQLERWYGVRFVLGDSSIAAEHLTLHVQAQSLDDVLQLISALTDLQHERADNLIRLVPRSTTGDGS